MGEWEKPTWAVIHLFALYIDAAVPLSEYVMFYQTMGKTLPCSKCRRHFADTITRLGVPRDHSDLFGWTVKLHNAVNRFLRKREYTESEAREFWEKYKNHRNSAKYMVIIGAFIVGLAIGYVITKWK